MPWETGVGSRGELSVPENLFPPDAVYLKMFKTWWGKTNLFREAEKQMRVEGE